MRQKNLGKFVIGHLNINSIRHKCHSLIEITTDILMISETPERFQKRIQDTTLPFKNA